MNLKQLDMVGIGYDLHKLIKDEKLILGGIKIPSNVGTLAHSDGDVLLHSIIDSLLGASGLGDIGEHFPDTDMSLKNANSVDLLKQIIVLIEKNGFKIINVDATIILEKPNLSNYKHQIKENIASILKINSKFVNIKAKTNEKQDSIGNCESIVALVISQIEQK